MPDFHEEEHPRGSSGKFTSGGGRASAARAISDRESKSQGEAIHRLSEAKARALREKAALDRGFTYDTVKDAFPTAGYAVSSHQEHERVLSGKAESSDLQRYVDDKAEILDEPGAHFGVWYDVENDKTYLDVTHVETDLHTAVRIAQDHNQEGIYDLKEHKTIIVKEASKRRR